MPPEVSSEFQLGQIQHEIDFVIVDVLKTPSVDPRNQGVRRPAGDVNRGIQNLSHRPMTEWRLPLFAGLREISQRNMHDFLTI